MTNRLRELVFATALFGVLVPACPATAQENQKAESKVHGSQAIQEQIDALKEGQQQILKELEEIKALLKDRSAPLELTPGQATKPVFTLRIQGEPFRGRKDARIAIIEYSDFECSYCARYVQEIFPLLEADYIKPGKVRYLFRDMPAREHTNAVSKARAARCAWDQGKFWEMHDRLFATQSAPDGADLAAHAQALGLNNEKFGICLTSGPYEDYIRQSVAGAKKLGIHGTPAFVIGFVSEDGGIVKANKIQVGGESYEAIREIVDELLASQPPK